MKFKPEDFKRVGCRCECDGSKLRHDSLCEIVKATEIANAKLQEWGISSENESCYPCHERCIHRIGSEK
jgi:hypothetical protein